MTHNEPTTYVVWNSDRLQHHAIAFISAAAVGKKPSIVSLPTGETQS